MIGKLEVLTLAGCGAAGAELVCRFPASAGLVRRQVGLETACAAAELLVMPRVYIATVRPEAGGVPVTVENVRENTVSVAVSCCGQAGAGAANGAFPANRQAGPRIATRGKGTVTCLLNQAPEAVERPFRFQMGTIFQ